MVRRRSRLSLRETAEPEDKLLRDCAIVIGHAMTRSPPRWETGLTSVDNSNFAPTCHLKLRLTDLNRNKVIYHMLATSFAFISQPPRVQKRMLLHCVSEQQA